MPVFRLKENLPAGVLPGANRYEGRAEVTAKISAGKPMKRRRVPGLIDLFDVSDPDEIRALARDPRLDRSFETATCPINGMLLQRSLKVLSFRGRRLPTMMPRDDAQRASRQQELWNSLSGKATSIKTGPEDLQPLAEWVRGVGPDAQLGILVQQRLGQLFSSEFAATEESWNAAKVLVAAPGPVICR
jgi:hypothetical protein